MTIDYLIEHALHIVVTGSRMLGVNLVEPPCSSDAHDSDIDIAIVYHPGLDAYLSTPPKPFGQITGEITLEQFRNKLEQQWGRWHYSTPNLPHSEYETYCNNKKKMYEWLRHSKFLLGVDPRCKVDIRYYSVSDMVRRINAADINMLPTLYSPLVWHWYPFLDETIPTIFGNIDNVIHSDMLAKATKGVLRLTEDSQLVDRCLLRSIEPKYLWHYMSSALTIEPVPNGFRYTTTGNRDLILELIPVDQSDYNFVLLSPIQAIYAVFMSAYSALDRERMLSVVKLAVEYAREHLNPTQQLKFNIKKADQKCLTLAEDMLLLSKILG